MTNNQMNSRTPLLRFDLEERTLRFSENILSLCKSLQQDTITRPLISQLVRSATSIGANYMEADEAGSRKDFANKVNIAQKETKETKYWLRLIAYEFPEGKETVRKLWKEAQELNLIFAAIFRKTKS